MGINIKEVSEITGLSPYTIRYYEKEGIIPPIHRDGGVRSFTDDNIAWIDMVICLKKTNMPINDIKKIVELSQLGDSTIDDRKAILLNHKSDIEAQIEELSKSLHKIDKKISFYDGAGSCD